MTCLYVGRWIPRVGSRDFGIIFPILHFLSAAELRLVNGSNHYEGRLEIFLNGQWGTVCGDYWDIRDARVACRQLGLPGVIAATLVGSFGSGSGPIYLDDLLCTGSESNLESCPHAGIGVHNCSHTNDAGARCRPAGKTFP